MSHAVYNRQFVEKKFTIGITWTPVSMLWLMVSYMCFPALSFISIMFSVVAILGSIYLLYIITLPAHRKHYKNFYKSLYASNAILSILFLLMFISSDAEWRQKGLVLFACTLPILLLIEHRYVRYKMNLHDIL